MQLLLDTHALLWWLLGDMALSAAAQAAIPNAANQTFVSAATAWEIAIKYKQGRLPGAARLIVDLDNIIAPGIRGVADYDPQRRAGRWLAASP